MSSGIGLSLRKHFASRWGFHTGAIAFAGGDGMWGNFGIQGMYSFKRTRLLRLYMLTGSTVFVNATTLRNAPNHKRISVDANLSIGAGFGIELHFTPTFGWAIELPLILTLDLNPKVSNTILDSTVSFLPIPSTAFSFYF